MSETVLSWVLGFGVGALFLATCDLVKMQLKLITSILWLNPLRSLWSISWSLTQKKVSGLLYLFFL